MGEPGSGWHVYSPQDVDLPDNVRRLHEETPALLSRGEVHVLVLGSRPGQSEVRIRSDEPETGARLSETALINAAIRELRLARQAFRPDPRACPPDRPVRWSGLLDRITPGGELMTFSTPGATSRHPGGELMTFSTPGATSRHPGGQIGLPDSPPPPSSSRLVSPPGHIQGLGEED